MMKANQRIKAAMRRNEREVLAYIRRRDREREPQRLTYCVGRSWANAIDRLVKKGVLTFDSWNQRYNIRRKR